MLPEGVDAIFPFAPNWRQPIEQRREYLTDIMYSRDRTEQRRALRAKPRQQLEMQLRLSGREALSCQQMLSVLQPFNLLIPVWPRVCRLTSEASVASRVLVLDRPFPADTRVGDHLVLMQEGAEPEAATLLALSTDRKTLTVDADLEAGWSVGASVYPAWQTAIRESVPGRRRAAGVLEAVLNFQCRVDPRPPAQPYGTAEATVDGSEVLLRRINWSDGLKTTFDWVPEVVDHRIGPFETFTDGRFSPLAFSADVVCESREEVDWWLGFFDRCQGRQRQFLVASHVDPLPLKSPTQGGISFEVHGTDLGYYAPPSNVVTHLQVRKPGGIIGHYAIDTITPDFEAGVTRISTLDAWDESYGPEEAGTTWLVFNARLASDAFNLRWYSTEVARFTLAVIATEQIA